MNRRTQRRMETNSSSSLRCVQLSGEFSYFAVHESSKVRDISWNYAIDHKKSTMRTHGYEMSLHFSFSKLQRKRISFSSLFSAESLTNTETKIQCHNGWFCVRCKQSDCGVWALGHANAKSTREFQQNSLFRYTYLSKLHIQFRSRPYCSVSFVTRRLHLNEVCFVCLPWFLFILDFFFQSTQPFIVFCEQLTSSHMESKTGVSSRQKKVNIEYSEKNTIPKEKQFRHAFLSAFSFTLTLAILILQMDE